MWPIRANRHTTSLRAMILGFLLVIFLFASVRERLEATMECC